MKRPAIFFDRDNTLIVSDGYLGDPNRVELIAGAADAIARARQMGFAVVTVSNQSGVARGYFTVEDVRAVNQRMDEVLRLANPEAVVDLHEFCPYHPDAPVELYRKDSDLRKPRPGMLYSAAQQLDLDLSASWMIGDAPRDITAGKAAGCRAILFADPKLAASPAALERAEAQPDAVVETLTAAIDYVQANRDGATTTTTTNVISSDHGGDVDDPGIVTARVRTPWTTTAAPARPRAPAALPAPASASSTAATSLRESPYASPADATRTERTLDQLLAEVRGLREQHQHSDFSIAKVLAGVAQVIALGVVFMAYFAKTAQTSASMVLTGIFLQLLVIALLLMDRQR